MDHIHWELDSRLLIQNWEISDSVWLGQYYGIGSCLSIRGALWAHDCCWELWCSPLLPSFPPAPFFGSHFFFSSLFLQVPPPPILFLFSPSFPSHSYQTAPSLMLPPLPYPTPGLGWGIGNSTRWLRLEMVETLQQMLACCLPRLTLHGMGASNCSPTSPEVPTSTRLSQGKGQACTYCRVSAISSQIPQEETSHAAPQSLWVG